jgi:hypothetical protein
MRRAPRPIPRLRTRPRRQRQLGRVGGSGAKTAGGGRGFPHSFGTPTSGRYGADFGA